MEIVGRTNLGLFIIHHIPGVGYKLFYVSLAHCSYLVQELFLSLPKYDNEEQGLSLLGELLFDQGINII